MSEASSPYQVPQLSRGHVEITDPTAAYACRSEIGIGNGTGAGRQHASGTATISGSTTRARRFRRRFSRAAAAHTAWARRRAQFSSSCWTASSRPSTASRRQAQAAATAFRPRWQLPAALELGRDGKAGGRGLPSEIKDPARASIRTCRLPVDADEKGRVGHRFDLWKYQYENLPNSETARRALEGGYSLTIRHAEWRIPCVFAAAVALQRATGAPVQANIYVTPPDERCVRPHADRHDVYAWQVSGAKTWLVREANGPPPPVPPRENKRNGGCDLPGAAPYPVERAVELRAGDTLYVPRGVPHQCRASGDAPSLHVSFGSDVHIPLTWEGALHCALRRRRRRPGPTSSCTSWRCRPARVCAAAARPGPRATTKGAATAAARCRLAADAATPAVARRAPGRAADWLAAPTNGVPDFVGRRQWARTALSGDAGARVPEDDRLGLQTMNRRPSVPRRRAPELTAPATRDVRVTGAAPRP